MKRVANKGSYLKDGLKHLRPSRSQIISGAMMFSAGIITWAAVPNIFTSGTAPRQ